MHVCGTTIEEPTRMRVLELQRYNPEWAHQYELEESLLRSVLGDVIERIHHIGSTSVVGLAAKPIIDILVEVRSLEDLDRRSGPLVEYGYEARGEFGIPGRRVFVKGKPNPTYHVHAFASGDANVARHLAFRNYLRKNDDVAKEYQGIKQQALEHCNNDIDKYCEYKNDFIKTTEALALELKFEA